MRTPEGEERETNIFWVYNTKNSIFYF
jgi:hypothetical protein